MMNENGGQKSHQQELAWRLDRRIGLPLLFALIFQSGIGLMWAGAIDQRVGSLEQTGDGVGQLLERTARLEEQVVGVRQSLLRLEDGLAAMSRQSNGEDKTQ